MDARTPSPLAGFIAALGPDAVRTAPEDGRRTFGPQVDVLATIYPANADEVATALRIAQQHALPVHPVSRGANWGMGSRAPTRGGGIVLDLSRIDAIDGFDPRQGRVHVQPGVTFRQLAEFLDAHTGDWFLPTIGGPVKASVLANALDRGDAIFCDRWTTLSDLDVVLPDGTMLDTGFGGGPLAAGGIAPNGALVDGLFSQSNLGVVVGGWLQLEPLPANISGWMFHIGPRENLPGFIEAWRQLQRQGTLSDRAVTLWNGIKYRGKHGQRKAYPADDIEKAQLDDWYCSAFLRGETPDIVAARDMLLEAALEPHITGGLQRPFRGNGMWSDGGADLLATPNQVNLQTVYWRHPTLPALDDMNPDRDGCGLIWLCLALPLEGQAILDFSVWCRARLKEADIDFNLGLEAASFRTALNYITIGYERGAEADATALSAYIDILEHALDCGYAPYRMANGAPVPERLRNSSRNDYLRAIRAVFDPNGILSPGRAGV